MVIRLVNLIAMMVLLGPALAVFAQPLQVRTIAQEGYRGKFNLDNSARPGICVEILRAVERIDPQIRFSGLDRRASMARIVADLEAGELDVVWGLIKNERRMASLIFSDTVLYQSAQVLVVRADDPIQIKSWDDVRQQGQDGLVITAARSAQSEYLRGMGGLLIDDNSNSSLANLRKLVAGRGRFLYGTDFNMVEDIAAQGFGARLRILPVRFQVGGMYAVFSRKTRPEIVERLNVALKKLEASGELKKIRSRYLPV